jgi:hypothetical protein
MLRLHEDGMATRMVAIVELKAVPLSPPPDGRLGAEVLALQERAMGQPSEKPKG